MVAIVGGNSLGLELSSLATLSRFGSRGAWGQAEVGGMREKVYVNAATGNLVVQHQDQVQNTRGEELIGLRTYNSLGQFNDDNGDNWTTGVYAQQIVLTGSVNSTGSTIKRWGRDGSSAIYSWNGTSGYVSTEGNGAHDTIVWDAAASKYTRTEGSSQLQEVYTSAGRLEKEKDANGQENSYIYNQYTNLLEQVDSSSGGRVVYEYIGTKLSSIRTSYLDDNGARRTAQLISYAYDSLGRLYQVKADLTPDDGSISDQAVFCTTYTYEGTSKRVSTLTQSDGSRLAFTYIQVGSDQRIETITDGMGGRTTYAYDTSLRKTTVTDPTGANWTYYYNASGDIVQIKNPANISEYYGYDSVSGDVLSISNGDGEVTNMLYDSNGNLIRVTDSNGQTTTRSYNTKNQIISESTSSLPTPLMLNKVGMALVGNSFVKADGQNGQWDSSICSSIGYSAPVSVGFQPAQNNKGFMVGLSDSVVGQSSESIDYALFCRSDSVLEIRVAGQIVGTTSYAVDDSLVIVASGTQVVYYKNNVALYTASTSAGTVFYLDSSFRDVGAQINALTYGSTQGNTFPLVAGNNVTIDATGVTKTTGGDRIWNASARSLAGFVGGAAVSFYPAQTNKAIMVGLGVNPTGNDDHYTLDFAIYCNSSGSVELFELGKGVPFNSGEKSTPYAVTDKFTVVFERETRTVSYYKNENVLRTVVLAENDVRLGKEFFLDSSFNGLGGRVQNLCFGSSTTNTIPVVGVANGSGASVNNDGFSKTGGIADKWDSMVRSQYGITGDVKLSFKAQQSNKALVIGLTTSPMSFSGVDKFSYAYELASNGVIKAREVSGGVSVRIDFSPAAQYTANDTFQIVYDASAREVKYLKISNSGELTVLRTVSEVTFSQPVYMDSVLYTAGAGVGSVRFGSDISDEAVTRYVYSASNSTQLRFVVSPQGRVTEYRYDNHGQRRSELNYYARSYSVRGLQITLDEATMKAWVAGIGDLSNVLIRKDLNYDARGLLTSETVWKSVDADGVGVGSGALKTEYIYDSFGRLWQVVGAASSSADDVSGQPSTVYSYDGLGRLLTITKNGQQVSSTVYEDSASGTVAILTQPGFGAGSRTTSSFYDKAGRLVSEIRSGQTGSTSYEYDSAGRLLMQTDPTGVRSFWIYDTTGRLVGTVDGTGTLTSNSYDGANRLTTQSTYPNSVDLGLLVDSVTGRALRPAIADVIKNGGSSSTHRWFYDDTGKVLYELQDATNPETGALTRSVVEFEYDGAGRLIRKTKYATGVLLPGAISVDMVRQQLRTPAVLATASQDRIENFFYDDDGLLIGQTDGEGYLTEYTYDGAGHRVQSTRFAQKINTSAISGGGSLDQLRPAADFSHDRTDTWYYNTQGLAVGHVDAEGYVTFTEYTERLQTRRTIRFATSVYDAAVLGVGALSSAPVAGTTTLDFLLAKVWPGKSNNSLGGSDQEIDYYYDQQDRLIKKIENTAGGVTSVYEYNAQGLIVQSVAAKNKEDERKNLVRYDDAGRKVAELSGVDAARLDTAGLSSVEKEEIWSKYATKYEWDDAGRLKSTTVKDVDQSTDLKTLYYYDSDGRVTYTINARGEVERTQYNAYGQKKSIIQYGTRLGSTSGLTGGLEISWLGRYTAAAGSSDSEQLFDYDSRTGWLVSKVAGDGARTSYKYNLFGQIIKATLPQGSGAGNTQPTATQLNSVTRTDSYWYDRRGLKLSQLQDSSGVAVDITHSWDAFENLLATENVKAGQTQYFEYDRLGRQIKQINSLQRSNTTGYDAFGHVIKTTDALQKTTRFTYSRDQNSLTVTTPENSSVTTTYNSHGQVASVRDANGHITRYTYNADGNLTKTERQPNGQTVWSVLETRDYDNLGRLCTVTDGAGTVTRSWYDAVGRISQKVTDPTDTDASVELNLSTSWTYDALGRVVSQTDASGIVTTYTFDAQGRTLTQTVDPSGLNLVTKWTYDAQGRVASVTDPLQYKKDPTQASTQYTYDNLGRRLKEITDPSGIKSERSWTYDTQGNVLTSTDRGVLTRYTYDQVGRLQYTVNALGEVSRNDYDDAGRLKTQTRFATRISPSADPIDSAVVFSSGADAVTRFFYDFDGRLKYSVDAVGGVTQRDYDANGNVIKITRYATAIAAGALPSSVVVNTADQIERMAYDANNRVIRHVGPEGAYTTTEYDSDGRVTAITCYAASSKGVDPATTGPIATAGKDTVTRYVYDAAGRALAEVDATGALTLRSFDELGRVTSQVRYATTISTTVALTASSLRAEAAKVTSAARDERIYYQYDAAGRLVWRAQSAGVDASGNLRYIGTSNTYDAAGRLIKVLRAGNYINLGVAPQIDGTLVGDLNISYTGSIQTDQFDLYGYDAAGRLVITANSLWQLTRYGYDAQGHKVYQNAYNLASDSLELAAARSLAFNTPTSVTLEALRSSAVNSNAGNREDRWVYDLAGNKTHHIDAEGGVEQWLYDAFGNVKRHVEYARPTSLSGLTEKIDSSTVSGRIVSDTSDRTTRYFYDAAGRQRFVVDAKGYVTETNYATISKIITRRYTRIPTISGGVSDTTSTTGLAANMTTLANSADRCSTQVLDNAGRVTQLIDALGTITETVFDGIGNTQTVTYAKGQAEQTTTAYVYDAAGRKTQTIVAQGTIAQSITVTSYDALDRVLTETDPRAEQLVSSDAGWAKDERYRRWAISSTTQAAALTDAQKSTIRSSFKSTYTYDAVGRVVSARNAVGATTSTEYDAFGNSVVVTDALGQKGYFYYDKLGRVQAQVDPAGYLTEHTYWGASKDIKTTKKYIAPLSMTGVSASTRPQAASDAVAAITTNTYDRLGRLTEARLGATQGMGDITESTTYASVSGTENTAVTNRFNRQVTNKLGGVASFFYDQLGRLVKETLPVTVSGKSIVNTYSYDALGNRTQSIEAEGLTEQRTTTFVYDVLGRLVQRTGAAYTTDSGTVVTPTDVTVYDRLGRVIETRQHAYVDASKTLGYDGGKRTLHYFDAAGHDVLSVAADGAVTQREFDAAGHVVVEKLRAALLGSMPSSAGGAQPSVLDNNQDRVTRNQYDSVGRLTQSSRDDVQIWSTPDVTGDINFDVNPARSVVLQSLIYDANGNVLQQTDGRGNSVHIYYDAIGRKLLIIDQAGYASGFEYTSSATTVETKYAQRLDFKWGRQYTTATTSVPTDPADIKERIKSATADEANRVTVIESDALGRVIRRTVKSVASVQVSQTGDVIKRNGDAVVEYDYNGLGSITQLREYVGDGSSVSTDFEYDKLGRETLRQGVSYFDKNGATVRQRTVTQYDGLGSVKSSTQLGVDDNVSTDDRITRFEYDVNGVNSARIVASGTANESRTEFTLDAAGQVVRSKQVSVIVKKDNTLDDLVTTYVFDAVGRTIQQTDVGTGEVRRFQYNAFGDITGKALGATGDWQEFATYNNLGKVQATNSNEGVYTVYLYDANGNVTREIKSTSDVNLRNKGSTLENLASLTDAEQLVYIYDNRNNMVRSVTKNLEFERISGDYSAYSLTDQSYSADERQIQYLTLPAANSGKSNTLALGSANSLSTKTAGSLGLVPQSHFVEQKVTPDRLATSAAGSVSFHGSINYVNHIDSIGYTLPISGTQPGLPLGEYRLVDEQGTVVATTTGESLVVPTMKWDDSFNYNSFVWSDEGNAYYPVAHPDWGEYGFGYYFSHERVLCAQYKVGGVWVDALTINQGINLARVNSDGDSSYDYYDSYVNSNVINTIYIATDGIVGRYDVVLNEGKSTQKNLTANDLKNGWMCVELSSLLEDVSQSITIRGYDSKGILRRYDVRSLTVSASGVSLLGSEQDVHDLVDPNKPFAEAPKAVWADMAGNVSGLALGLDAMSDLRTSGSTVRLKVHEPGSNTYKTIDLGADGNIFRLNNSALGLVSGKNYEFFVYQDDQSRGYKGSFTYNGANAAISNLSDLTRWSQSTSLSFDATGYAASTQGGALAMELVINGKTVTATASSGKFTFSAAQLGAVLTNPAHPWLSANSYGYSYKVYTQKSTTTGSSNPPETSKLLLDAGSGALSVGQNCKLTASSASTQYRPQAWLSLPGSSLAEEMTLSSMGLADQVWANGDWRRTSTSVGATSAGQLVALDLSDYIPGSGNRSVTVNYSGAETAFTAVYNVDASGLVTQSSLSYRPLASNQLQLSLPNLPRLPTGAKLSSFKVLKAASTDTTVATSGTALSATALTSGTSAGGWRVTVPTSAGAGNYRLYYEISDSAGVVIAKGLGNYAVASASGALSDWTLDVPQQQPSYLMLQVPSGTSQVSVTLGGTTYSTSAHADRWISVGNQRWLDVSALRPASGVGAALTLSVTATDASGMVLASTSGGSVQLNSAGGLSAISLGSPARPQTLVQFQGPQGGINLPTLRLTLTEKNGQELASPVTVNIAGTWKPDLGDEGAYTYDWLPDAQWLPSSELSDPINLVAIAQLRNTADTSGVELGKVKLGLTYAGRLQSAQASLSEVGGVLKLKQNAQTASYRIYNAFGELQKEWSDVDTQRANAMLSLYKSEGLTSTATLDPDKQRTLYAYNTLGLLTRKTLAESFVTADNGYVSRQQATLDFGYDWLGRQTTATDANNNLTKQFWVGGSADSGQAHVQTQWSGVGAVTHHKFDEFGQERRTERQLTAQADLPQWYTTEQDYNALGQLTTARTMEFAVNLGEAATTLTDSYTYDAMGHRLSHTNAASSASDQRTDYTWYDSLGRVLKTQSAQGLSTDYSYELISTIKGLDGAQGWGWRTTTVTADGYSLVDDAEYFGRVSSHTDRAERVTTYSLNHLGQITLQTSTFGAIKGSTGQKITNEYDNHGNLVQQKDHTAHTLSEYRYDGADQRISEAFYTINASNSAVQSRLSLEQIVYDELGRMARVGDRSGSTGGDDTHDVRYEYDAQGNVRAIRAWYAQGNKSDSLWYDYDADNRFTLSGGSLEDSQNKFARGTSASDTSVKIEWGNDSASHQGTFLTYDLAGRRTSAAYFYNPTADTTKNRNLTENYRYRADGYLQDVTMDGAKRSERLYDKLGRTTTFTEYNTDSSIRQQKVSTYDADGRILTERQTGSQVTKGWTKYSYFIKNATNDGVANGAGVKFYGEKDNYATPGQGGLATVVFYPDDGGITDTVTTYTYDQWDDARQLVGKVTQNGTGTGTSTNTYDVNGHLQSVKDVNKEGTRDVIYTTNAQGQVLKRVETMNDVTYTHRSFYALGQRVGSATDNPLDDRIRQTYAEELLTNLQKVPSTTSYFKGYAPVTSRDFDQSYDPINSKSSGAPISYTARSGDTLQGIAQVVWGDASLWYLLADANHLSGAETLSAGQVISVPGRPTNSHNNASTTRPYNPSELAGNVSPRLPKPPTNNCAKTASAIIGIIVAVVVTYYTWDPNTGTQVGSAVAAAVAGNAAQQYSYAAMTGNLDLSDILSKKGYWRMVDPTSKKSVSWRLHHPPGFTEDLEYDYSATARAAAAAYIMAPAGGGAGGASGAASASAADWASAAAMGALRGAEGAALNMAMQGKWDWNQIAAGAIGGAAGAGLASQMDPGFASDFISSAASGLISDEYLASTERNYNRSNGAILFTQALGAGMQAELAKGSSGGGGQNTKDANLEGKNSANEQSFSFDKAGINVRSALDNSNLGNDFDPTSGKNIPLSDRGLLNEADAALRSAAAQAPRSATVGKNRSVLAELRASGVPERLLPAAYGQVYSSGQLKSFDARANPIVQPGQELTYNLDSITSEHFSVGRALISNAGAFSAQPTQASGSGFRTDGEFVAALGQLAELLPPPSEGEKASIGKMRAAMDSRAALKNDTVSFTTGSVLKDQLAGGFIGGLKSFSLGVDASVRVLGNAVLMIGDILTGGMNRDSDIIQQARIEMGALAHSVLNPGEAWRGIETSFNDRTEEASTLRSQGRYFDAAIIDGSVGGDVVQLGLGAYGLTRGVKLLATAALENVGSGPLAGSRSAQFGAVDADVYADIRTQSPSNAIRKMVNLGPKIDPVYGYSVSRLEADHIISLKDVTNMEGFDLLSLKDQVAVANLPENFMGLGKSTNASKGAQSWAEWPGHSKLGPVPQDVRTQMLAREERARAALQEAIKQRLENGRK